MSSRHPSLYDHGKRESAAIDLGKASADVVIEFLQPGNDNAVMTHPRHDLGHGMGKVGKCFRPIIF